MAKKELTTKEKILLPIEASIKDKAFYFEHFKHLIPESEHASFEAGYKIISKGNRLSYHQRYEVLNEKAEWVSQYELEHSDFVDAADMRYNLDRIFSEDRMALPIEADILELNFPNLPQLFLYIDQGDPEVLTYEKEFFIPNFGKTISPLGFDIVLRKPKIVETKARMVVETYKKKYMVQSGMFKEEIAKEQYESLYQLYVDTYKTINLELNTSILNSRLKQYKLIS